MLCHCQKIDPVCTFTYYIYSVRLGRASLASIFDLVYMQTDKSLIVIKRVSANFEAIKQSTSSTPIHIYWGLLSMKNYYFYVIHSIIPIDVKKIINTLSHQ